MTPSDVDYQRAVDLLVAGELVAIPTETVYGLGADAANPAAVAKIFAAKGRPADHPLIVHLAGHDAVDHWAEQVPPVAWELMETFWPGPLTLIVPRRNDSWIVAAASRSYYRTLVQAGVRIFEYNGGLLHAKLLTIDGEVTLIGSANMDRRSFELNYENNIALYDRTLTQSIIARQNEYIAASTPVTLADIDQWRKPKLLWYNTVATMGPVL